MTEKFHNKYRIPSARLQHWDYGSNALYFVTICTAQRVCCFGEIVNGTMELSEIGKIAQQCWNEIPKHFPFVTMGAFVVMPNHVHGIIMIDKPYNRIGDANDDVNDDANDDANVDANDDATVETPKLGVSTNPTMITPPITNTAMATTANRQQTFNASKKWKPETLGVIINQYKRICTINARKMGADFAWQPRFHDHIIRNDESFQRISNYIINNPANWVDNTFYL